MLYFVESANEWASQTVSVLSRPETPVLLLRATKSNPPRGEIVSDRMHLISQNYRDVFQIGEVPNQTICSGAAYRGAVRKDAHFHFHQP